MTFEDDANDDTARGQVLEPHAECDAPHRPRNWQIGANTTSTGEIFRYVITAHCSVGQTPEAQAAAERAQLAELRALQDWVLGARCSPGARASVMSMPSGAGIKQYQVLVKPDELIRHGVTLCSGLHRAPEQQCQYRRQHPQNRRAKPGRARRQYADGHRRYQENCRQPRHCHRL